jgi:alkanesulfonate monooxygenase SsuD/methylene tetrahydromethanopterin reductase-like flavin-dependent oxidoreductase (luciferase family)
MSQRGNLKVARPKVIIQVYPMLPSDGEEDRKAKRPLGRDSALYHRVIHEYTEVLAEAEKLGVWGACSIEHHLHSEGYEVGPAPGVLNAFWAAKFSKLHVGALGYVMATQDPIRVAEETAVIDHLSEGRFFVGFARGYQSRWTNILGQFSNSVAAVSDGGADDQKNRDIFEERVDMVLDCWTQKSVKLDGNYYKAPYPSDTGVRGYPAWKISRDAGTEGEVDETGAIRRVSVVPSPYQQPHPPVFVATSKSDASISYCARKGFIPCYFSNFDKIREHSKIYVSQSATSGHPVRMGEKQNIVRWVHICDNEADYDRKLRDYDVDIYKNFYAPFFPQFPSDPNTEFAQNIKESGIYIGGTIEQVRQAWIDIYSEFPAEYITLIFHYAQQPKDDVIATLTRFMTEVVPYLEAPDTQTHKPSPQRKPHMV